MSPEHRHFRPRRGLALALPLVAICGLACGRSPATSHPAVAQRTGAAAKTPTSKAAPSPPKPPPAAAEGKNAPSPSGPLATADFALERRCPLARQKASPVKAGFDVKLSMQWPTRAPSEALLAALRGEVTKQLTGQRVATMPPKAVLEGAFLVHCAEYRAAHADELVKAERGDMDVPLQGADWHLDITVGVKAEPTGLVRVHAGRNSYSGGAHGNQEEAVRTFVAATGEPLAIADLLTEAGMTRLRASLIEQARTEPTLKEHVDEPEKVAPSEDFVVTTAGIEFRYDAYDIAAYAAGPQEIVVAWADLLPTLRDDAPWRPEAAPRPQKAASHEKAASPENKANAAPHP